MKLSQALLVISLGFLSTAAAAPTPMKEGESISSSRQKSRSRHLDRLNSQAASRQVEATWVHPNAYANDQFNAAYEAQGSHREEQHPSVIRPTAHRSERLQVPRNYWNTLRNLDAERAANNSRQSNAYPSARVEWNEQYPQGHRSNPIEVESSGWSADSSVNSSMSVSQRARSQVQQRQQEMDPATLQRLYQGRN
jgi:hypothetical protein